MAAFAALENNARGLSNLERQFRRDFLIRLAANSVRSKI
jgi:hypothetical protein